MTDTSANTSPTQASSWGRLRSTARTALLAFAPTKRSVVASSAAASAAVLALAGGAVASSHVTLTVEVDGVTRPYSTFATSVSSVLADLGVEVTPADHVAPALTESVRDGQTILVRHARSVDVDVNGRTTTIKTTADSLQDVLEALTSRGDVHAAANRHSTRDDLLPLVDREQDIPVVIGDRTLTIHVKPGDDIRGLIIAAGQPLTALDRVNARVESGALSIHVDQVTRGIVTEKEALPFKEKSVESADLFKGESVITTPGANGETTKTLWRETVGGQVQHVTEISRAVSTQPVEQVRSLGTKEATPVELMKAGLDPKAQLEDGTEEDGTPSKRYRARLGSISSASEIRQLRRELGLAPGQALPGQNAVQASYSGEDPKAIAQGMVAARGWSDGEFQCLLSLWQRESNWNPYAENPSSGAYGIPQSLPGSKMASAGADWRTNPATQITWGLGYIAGRYGSPCGAWGHSQSVGWY